MLKVWREFFSHVANGFTGAWSQCFSEALRGLQVVCYGGCLGSGDKAAGRLSQVQQTLPGSGEVASRAQQSGTSVSDATCHRLFPVDNCNGKSQTKNNFFFYTFQAVGLVGDMQTCLNVETVCTLLALLGYCEGRDS